MSAADQLAEELAAKVAGPVGEVLGIDLAGLIRSRADEVAGPLIERLRDPDEGPDLARALVSLLWGTGTPPSAWWVSELGEIVGVAADVTVTHREAAEILGIARGTVSILTQRGALGRDASGNVTLSSVLARRVRLSAKPEQ